MDEQYESMLPTNSKGRTSKTIKAFASAYGQQDNIGDIVLRRNMLNALRRDSELHVYTGSCSAAYVQSLQLNSGDNTYESLSKWLAAVAKSIFSQRTIFAFNTGEVEINRRFALSRLLAIPLRILMLLKGGAIVHAGQGIKKTPTRLWASIASIGLRACSIVSWRDPRSHRLMGIGETAPDWAFMELAADNLPRSDQKREFLTISLRGDRLYPSKEWLQSVHDYARQNNLELAVATQVNRDSSYSIQLASDLGAHLIDWTTDKNHAEQEKRLRNLYSQSALVLSDRLHVLVVAMCEGAIPIDCSVAGNHKIRNTFQESGLKIGVIERPAANGDSPQLAPQYGLELALTEREVLGKQITGSEVLVSVFLESLSKRVRNGRSSNHVFK